MMNLRKLILVIALCLPLTACVDSTLYLVNSIARIGEYNVTRDIEYGPHDENRLDFYRPANVKARGTIIFFYGGCWGACETLPKDDYRFVAQTLTNLGFAVAIPDYRLYPDVKFLAIMDDASMAFQWVSDHHREFGVDSESIVVMGHSAGAHIAAMLAANEDYLGDDLYSRMAAFIGLAGPYDFPFDQEYQFELFSELDYEESMPTSFIDGSEAPMLLMHGDDDDKVILRNLVKMREAIESKNGRVETRVYQEVGHAQIIAALFMPLRNRYPVAEDISLFLKQL